MESLTAADGKYTLEQGLETLHAENKMLQHHVEFWKREVQFLDHLLVKNLPFVTSEPNKKDLEHFQNRLFYYRGEVIDQLAHDLRETDNYLAKNMQANDSNQAAYRNMHYKTTDAVRSFEKVYNELKNELFTFIEHLD